MKIHLYNPEGDLIADIETQEGVMPRVGESVRIEALNADFKVEFVRWNLGEECEVQVMMEKQEKKDTWPEGAPEAGEGKVLKFKSKRKKDDET